ncbi:hypothetical protein L6452_21390 [Arctium lappa]|uniref:Uncharacterized protein n=1 Tax=Arctium lappa TaxID=4217 RepID=A0ACB9BD74_ARCLA|nr:hypothetical protein L6452_21390 [Arctium lappa]
MWRLRSPYEGDDERDHYDHSEDEDCDYIDEEDDITNDEDMMNVVTMNFHLNTDRELEWIRRTDPDNPVVDVDEEALDFSDDQSRSDEDDYELKRNQHLRQISKSKVLMMNDFIPINLKKTKTFASCLASIPPTFSRVFLHFTLSSAFLFPPFFIFPLRVPNNIFKSSFFFSDLNLQLAFLVEDILRSNHNEPSLLGFTEF